MLDNEGFANQYNFVQLGLKHELKSFKVADLSPKYIFGNAADCTKLDLNPRVWRLDSGPNLQPSHGESGKSGRQ